MFTLAFHLAAIAILLALVYPMAYGRGFRAGERKARRMFEADSEDKLMN